MLDTSSPSEQFIVVGKPARNPAAPYQPIGFADESGKSLNPAATLEQARAVLSELKAFQDAEVNPDWVDLCIIRQTINQEMIGEHDEEACAPEKESNIWNALAWMYHRLRPGFGRLAFVEQALEEAKHQAENGATDDASASRIAELEEQVRQLRGALVDSASAATMLRQIAAVDGGINVMLEGGMCQLMASAFVDQFTQQGGVNFVEMGFTTPEGEPFIVTMQKVNGKTPAQLKAEVEQQRAVLAAALQPFAELAELFDDGKRGTNMPSSGLITSWPRLHKEYELKVEHLRAARAAIEAIGAAVQSASNANGVAPQNQDRCAGQCFNCECGRMDGGEAKNG